MLVDRLKLWFCFKQFLGSKCATSPVLSMLKFLSKTKERLCFSIIDHCILLRSNREQSMYLVEYWFFFLKKRYKAM